MEPLVKQLSYFLLIAAAVFLISCKDKSTEPDQLLGGFKGQVNDESGNPVSGASVFIIYDENSLNKIPKILLDTLPAELSSFTASVSGNIIQLNWETKTEHNSKGFDIERGDTSFSWTSIGYVDAAGLSNSPKQYSFTDINVVAGKIYYYRLKMSTIDGSFQYSSMIVSGVPLPLLNNLSQCYPNPFTNNFTVNFGLAEDSKISLKILDYKKSSIKRTLMDDFANSSSKHNSGAYNIYFNDTSQILLGNGIYFIQYIFQSINNGKTDTLERIICKLENDLALLQRTETNSVSGSDGKFTIKYDNFYPNVEYIRTGVDGPDSLGTLKFTNYPSIVLMKDGYQTLVKKITVDISGTPETTFVLNKIK
jgi:hypothetical protein